VGTVAGSLHCGYAGSGQRDQAGICGNTEKHHQHTGDFDWSGKDIFIRPIDIDVHYGHFRQVKWENVKGMFYIAPNFLTLLKKNFTFPEDLMVEETILSIKMDEWKYRDRPCGEGRKIAWVNHNWTAKGLNLAYIALNKLITITGDSSWELHVVSNGRSTEHWYFDYLDHLAKTLDIEDRITQYATVESIDEFLDDKDFLWQTSLKEGFSLICAEAMAKGLHVYMNNWQDSEHIWGSNVVSNTPESLATKTATDVYSSEHFRELAATHSHDKEIARLRELTGL